MPKLKKQLPLKFSEIKKYIKIMGYELLIYEDWSDLVGATIRIPKTDILIELNKFGKYSIEMQGSKEKAYLAAAQKAYLFVKKYLRKHK